MYIVLINVFISGFQLPEKKIKKISATCISLILSKFMMHIVKYGFLIIGKACIFGKKFVF